MDSIVYTNITTENDLYKHTVPSIHKFTLACECIVCHARVACECKLALDTSAVASVTQISIYGIATDDYVSFKLLIVNVFVPAVLL